MLVGIEFRKHLPLFLTIYAVTFATGILAASRPDVVTFDVIRGMAILLTWSAAAIYTAAVIVRFVTLGGDLLLQISDVGRWKLAWMKASVLASLMFVQHLLGAGLQLETFLDAAGPNSSAVVSYLVVAKAVSIATFLAMVVLVSTAAKLVHGRGGSVAAFWVMALALVVAQVIALWRLGAPDTEWFFIGVGGEFTTVNLYADILPIVLTAPAEGVLPPIAMFSVLINAVAGAAFVLAWAALVRLRRFDFVAL